MQFEDNTYGTIRKRKVAKALPAGPLGTSSPTPAADASAPKRKKPLPMAPGGKENTGDNTPLSCSKLSAPQEMKKELPTSPTNVISPPHRRLSKGKKRSMSPKPVRPKTWTMSDRFDPKHILEKEAAVKDAEFVLGVVSEYQKRIQRIAEECSEVSRLTAISKIDTDVSIISKALGPLCSVPVTAPSTPSKGKGLTGGQEDIDLLEGKLFQMAKKLIEIKAVIERTESPKRTSIMATIIASIKKYIVHGEVPSDLPHIPVEMAISLINPATASSNILQELQENVYRSGFLKKQGKTMKILRKRWCALNHHEFQIFDSNRQNKKAIPLDAIINITCTLKDGYYHMIIGTLGKKTVLASKNRIEMAKWVLTVDSMIRPEYTSVISVPSSEHNNDEKSLSKEQLLSLLYKEPFGSGRMISETYEEIWHYNGATGLLSNSKWGDTLEYIWDGSSLAPTKMSQMSLGTGKWNGVWLAWYTEKNEPFLKYYYSAGDRKLTLIEKDLASHGQSLLTWQWALNQLVGEGGEWICDGNIPHPVVMFLQMMRYYRLGR